MADFRSPPPPFGADETPAEIYWAEADDGLRLRLGLWRGTTATAGTVLLFPGRTEYLEKYAPVAADLTAAGLSVLGIDWRGQGASQRLLSDPRPGHITDFADYQRDVRVMVDLATRLDLPKPWHLLAHSMGAAIGLRALMNGLPVATAAFSAPMWGIDTGRVPVGVALGLAQAAQVLGHTVKPVPGSGANGTYVLDSGFAGNLLTGSATAWARMVAEADAWPDLTLGGATFGWVGAALRECRALARAPLPAIPSIVTLGSGEAIVSAAAIRATCARWPSARLITVEGGRHEALFETAPRRAQVITALLTQFG
ncbi:alpha/beta fold hydrolase [Paracoccus pacificus]|uniref:Alpha/beta fold hydrolase n=1 Tax=Paracoccus pacificus TaxID=1463598 RepID=A0ABW4RA03_9RHOB